MRLKVQRLPLRWSSTIRLPFLRPSSRRSWPSRPVAPRPSIQPSRPATSCEPARSAPGGGGEPAGWLGCAAGKVAAAVAIGRLLAPANTVTRPSVSMRTDSSAPTRLRLDARRLPVSRPAPDMPTSAFGALATTVPSASRTTMSRKRSDVRPFSSRSIWVPPTDDGLLAAEILLDRRFQPRRRHVEFDRAARETPPQAGDADHGDCKGGHSAPEQAPHRRPARKI